MKSIKKYIESQKKMKYIWDNRRAIYYGDGLSRKFMNNNILGIRVSSQSDDYLCIYKKMFRFSVNLDALYREGKFSKNINITDSTSDLVIDLLDKIIRCIDVYYSTLSE